VFDLYYPQLTVRKVGVAQNSKVETSIQATAKCGHHKKSTNKIDTIQAVD
jgi:hypothetical protein